MKVRDFENDAFTDFMEDDSNFGQLAVLPGSGAFQVGLVKVSLDDRFTLLLGDSFHAGRDSTGRSQMDFIRACVSGAELHRAGIYDSKDGELYDADYDLGHLAETREDFRALTHTSHGEVLKALEKDVEERVSSYINDPVHRDELVAAAKSEAGFRQPCVSENRLKQLLVDGTSLAEFAEQPISVGCKVPTDVAAFMEYLTDPERFADSLAEDLIGSESSEYGYLLLSKEEEVAAYRELIEHQTPNIGAAGRIKQAVDSAFPDAKPKTVRLTVARDGKEIQFQCPMRDLERVFFYPDQDISTYNVAPVAKREEIDSTFGLLSHKSHGRSYEAAVYAQDIVDVSYRGKSVYRVPDAAYADKTATREVQVAVYEPCSFVRDSLFQRSGTGWNAKEVLVPDATDTHPGNFVQVGTSTVTVGAHSDPETMCSDILKQCDSAWNAPGNLVAVDGQAYMLDDYWHVMQMPFTADELPGLWRGPERRAEEPMSLSDRISGGIVSGKELGGSDEPLDHSHNDGHDAL